MDRANEVVKGFNEPSKREIRRAKQGRRHMTEEKAYANELAIKERKPSKREIRRAKQGWRPMTEEEKAYANELAIKERKRYEMNLKIGGVDDRGIYTRLSDREVNTWRYGKGVRIKRGSK